VVTTLLPPNAGTMEVFGLDTRRSTMRIRRLVGYVPQQLSIDGQPTGLAHYRMSALIAVGIPWPWQCASPVDRL
jgi:ABC-type multidrug transport system ATPase subunit